MSSESSQVNSIFPEAFRQDPYKKVNAANEMETVNGFEDGDFPRYLDGDVLISLCDSWHYQLHSMTLKLSSSFFRTVLTEDNAVILDETALENGVCLRYRFDFELPNFSAPLMNAPSSIGILTLRALNPDGKPAGPPTVPRQQLENAIYLKEEPQFLHTVFKHYDNVFRSYYHRQPQFSKSNMIDVLREDARGVVQVANALGSIGSIRMPLDVAFYGYGQTLFRSIADDPVAWADIALRIRSESILREAVCHIVGRWSEVDMRVRVSFCFGLTAANSALKAKVSDAEKTENSALFALIERKANELDAQKRHVETRMMGFYPDEMRNYDHQPNVGVGSVTIRGIGEPTKVGQHTKHIYLWMAVSLFRQWMGQQLVAERTRMSNDGGKSFYTAIWQGSESYLTFDDCERFMNAFPLSAKARTGFDSALSQLKEGLKFYVRNFVRLRSSLDVKKFPVPWLTCTAVLPEELPWKTNFTLNSLGRAEQTTDSLQVPPIPTAARLATAQVGNSNTIGLLPALSMPYKTASTPNVPPIPTSVSATLALANNPSATTVNPVSLTRHFEARVQEVSPIALGPTETPASSSSSYVNSLLPALSTPQRIASGPQAPAFAAVTPETTIQTDNLPAKRTSSTLSTPRKKVTKTKTARKRKTSFSDTDTDVDSTGDYVPPSANRERKKKTKSGVGRATKASLADSETVSTCQHITQHDSGAELSQSEISGALTPHGPNYYKWGESNDSWNYMEDEFGECDEP